MDEIKELKEKFLAELDQVRSLVQKLEDKEAEITNYSTNLDTTGNEETFTHSQYPDYMDRRALSISHSKMGPDLIDRQALMRVNSEIGPLVNQETTQTTPPLSVSILDNNTNDMCPFWFQGVDFVKRLWLLYVDRDTWWVRYKGDVNKWRRWMAQHEKDGGDCYLLLLRKEMAVFVHVALKTLIVIHRALRELDPTFQEELLNYGRSRNHVLNLCYFKDDSSPNAWDYSGWVRTYALYLEERLECLRVLKYDVGTERSRTKDLDTPDLVEQLPALQQLLFRVLGCQPQRAAVHNFVIQLALSMASKSVSNGYCLGLKKRA
ncbi:hypothetical protein L2E82_32267 [Cichorium intybus]|uniref:Uncharacterized protein n=1 Tax=Cichorium intybus TaxID=13427 RepID=A0ACB9BHJ7_CICIN|nr:hypothetical protein L2E82_32267 [Cichorium intybus]